jgi:alpha-glucosidase (family GH31 glycosyl hydrolase)
MGSDQDTAGRRTGPFSRHERRYSTKKSENGLHEHMDAKSCRLMLVIMEYDMADNGRYSRNRRKKEIIMKREEQDTQELQKEERSDYQQNTRRNICDIFHSMPRRNVN